jgi:hypothetical protein
MSGKDPIRQWVNLKKDSAFVEKDVPIERVGHLHYESGLKKGHKNISFKVRVVPIVEEPYSKTEQGRNGRFRIIGGRGVRVQHGKKAKHRETDIYLPAAGGNQYVVEAKLWGESRRSTTTIEAFRRLYYQEMRMDAPDVAPGAFLAKVDSELEKDAYITLVKRQPDETVPHRLSLHDDNENAFIRDVKAKYALEKLRPFSYVVVWIDQAATLDEEVLKFDLAAHPTGEKNWVFDPGTDTLTCVTDGWLWEGLDNAGTPAPKWLKGGTWCLYRDANGKESETRLPDSATEIYVDSPSQRSPRYDFAASLQRTKKGPMGGYDILVIDLTGYVSRPGTTLIGLRSELAVCTGFSNGFAYTSINLFVVCSRVWWGEPRHDPNLDPKDEQRMGTFRHELGHKLGLVPKGSGLSLDRPKATQYEAHGHKGSHCKDGAVVWDNAQQEWSGVPGCVMFGSNASGTDLRPATYCGSCALDLRRVDLGDGNPGFADSVWDF